MKKTIFEFSEFSEYEMLQLKAEDFNREHVRTGQTEEQRAYVQILYNEGDAKFAELIELYISIEKIDSESLTIMIDIAIKEKNRIKNMVLIGLFYGIDEKLLLREEMCRFFASFFENKNRNIHMTLILAEHCMDFVMGIDHLYSVCYAKILFENYQRKWGDGFYGLFNKTMYALPNSQDSLNFLLENLNYPIEETREDIEECYKQMLDNITPEFP